MFTTPCKTIQEMAIKEFCKEIGTPSLKEFIMIVLCGVNSAFDKLKYGTFLKA